jgi:hypothetical protein
MRSVKHFIDKFTLVPEDGWTSAQELCDPGVPFQGKTGLWWPAAGSERQEINTLIWRALYENVCDIDDGSSRKFKQATAKERVLDALNKVASSVQ